MAAHRTTQPRRKPPLTPLTMRQPLISWSSPSWRRLRNWRSNRDPAARGVYLAHGSWSCPRPGTSSRTECEATLWKSCGCFTRLGGYRTVGRLAPRGRGNFGGNRRARTWPSPGSMRARGLAWIPGGANERPCLSRFQTVPSTVMSSAVTVLRPRQCRHATSTP